MYAELSLLHHAFKDAVEKKLKALQVKKLWLNTWLKNMESSLARRAKRFISIAKNGVIKSVRKLSDEPLIDAFNRLT